MPDAIDALDLSDTFESPELFEQVMQRIYRDALDNPDLARALRQNFLQEDVAQSLEEFSAAPIADQCVGLLDLLGYGKDAAICDLGCGRGYLAYALDRRGYSDVSAMDPNNEMTTGTAYLRAAAPHIPVINDLAAWRKTFGRFDVIVSRATVHHWQHIPMVALDARRTLKPGGLWIAFDEYFATTAAEIVTQMNGHLLTPKYRTYEWAYPASAYVDLISSVGFELVSAGDTFKRRSDLARQRLKFWLKVAKARLGRRVGVAPGVMIFRRLEQPITP